MMNSNSNIQPDRDGDLISGAKPKLPSFPAHRGEEACAITHATPIDDPEQVHQITPALFAQYEVDGGNVTLGGCLMEDVPFLRIESEVLENPTISGSQTESLAEPDQGSNETGLISTSSQFANANRLPRRLTTIYVFDEQGQQVPPNVAHDLGLDYPEPASAAPTNVNPHEVGRWLAPLIARLQNQFEQANQRVIRCEIVWCKRATGKIVVNLDDQSASIPFSGWARQLATGRTPLPPFKCPHTQRESYRITNTESGELTVPEALKTCAVSGRRVLETELESCEATERLCLPEYLAKSEASGKRVMKSKLAECVKCGQKVSPDEVHQGRCVTCERIGARPIDSHRVKALVAEFPGLRSWKSWQFSESASCELYQGYGWLKTIFLCIDKETRTPRRVATGGKLASQLTQVPESDWAELLGQPPAH